MRIRKPLFYMTDPAGAGGEGGSGSGDPAGGSTAGGAAPAAGSSGGDNGGKPEGGKPDEGKSFTQADVDRIIAGRLQKYADYDAIVKERDQLREANQTEQEKAVTEARKEGQKEARREAAKDLAREVFNGTAARRNPEHDAASALEFVDLGRFVKDDGSVDRDAIKDAVERLVPEKQDAKPAPSFGGGARKTDDGKTDVKPGMGRLRAAYSTK